MRSACCSSQRSSELALALSLGAWAVMSRLGMIASWGTEKVIESGLGHVLISALLYSGTASGLVRRPAPRPSSASAGPPGLGLPQQICRKKRGQALRGDHARGPGSPAQRLLLVVMLVLLLLLPLVMMVLMIIMMMPISVAGKSRSARMPAAERCRDHWRPAGRRCSAGVPRRHPADRHCPTKTAHPRALSPEDPP